MLFIVRVGGILALPVLCFPHQLIYLAMTKGLVVVVFFDTSLDFWSLWGLDTKMPLKSNGWDYTLPFPPEDFPILTICFLLFAKASSSVLYVNLVSLATRHSSSLTSAARGHSPRGFFGSSDQINSMQIKWDIAYISQVGWFSW